MATKNTRTGLIQKTGDMAIYQPYMRKESDIEIIDQSPKRVQSIPRREMPTPMRLNSLSVGSCDSLEFGVGKIGKIKFKGTIPFRKRALSKNSEQINVQNTGQSDREQLESQNNTDR